MGLIGYAGLFCFWFQWQLKARMGSLFCNTWHSDQQHHRGARKADCQAQPRRSWIRICLLTRCPGDWFEKHCSSGLGLRRWTANPFLGSVSASPPQVNSPPCPAVQLLSNLGGKKFESWVSVLALTSKLLNFSEQPLFTPCKTNNFPGLLRELDACVV